MGRDPVIEVQGITKHFGGRPAIVDLSFSVSRGQALGLVGPDGAGKSTALRILSGCLRPTFGTARVAGHDVLARSRDARRRAGYLPTPLPLYEEMRVEPYLDTMCRLRGLRRAERRERIDQALSTCGLADHRREVIAWLPPPQRQRLGLAQATVHDPEVLILDEPAAGLDAAESEQIRDLVARLSDSRAVVLTGRVHADVSGVCERVLVLEQGRLISDSAPNGRDRRPTREVVAVVRGDAAGVETHVRELAGVVAVTLTDAGDGDHRVTATGHREDLQDAVARVIVERGYGLKELRASEPVTVEADAT